MDTRYCRCVINRGYTLTTLINTFSFDEDKAGRLSTRFRRERWRSRRNIDWFASRDSYLEFCYFFHVFAWFSFIVWLSFISHLDVKQWRTTSRSVSLTVRFPSLIGGKGVRLFFTCRTTTLPCSDRCSLISTSFSLPLCLRFRARARARALLFINIVHRATYNTNTLMHTYIHTCIHTREHVRESKISDDKSSECQ